MALRRWHRTGVLPQIGITDATRMLHRCNVMTTPLQEMTLMRRLYTGVTLLQLVGHSSEKSAIHTKYPREKCCTSLASTLL